MKSNVLGIIAEYSPFHNGHLQHLIKSKELTNSEFTICVMGGNFGQRGTTSLIDKWAKAEMAIRNGIDLVIELPVIYNLSSAENFASGAIKVLDSLKIVDFLSFGSESGDIHILNSIAQVLIDQPSEYVTMLNRELNQGNSFPKAREKALLLYLNNIRKYANVISSPNNILGIEYIKALIGQKSTIKPITIKRHAVNHNETHVKNNITSATAIREYIRNGRLNEVANTMPAEVVKILKFKLEHGECVYDINSLEKEILFTLRKMTLVDISNLPDVTEGLEFSIKNAANSCNNVKDLIFAVKSKRYTHTRITRILLYAILGITKKDMEVSLKSKPYIRVLGFNKNGEFLLSQIAKQSKQLPIITSPKKFLDKNTNRNLKRMLDIDIWATNVYTLAYEFNSSANLDFTKNLVKL